MFVDVARGWRVVYLAVPCEDRRTLRECQQPVNVLLLPPLVDERTTTAAQWEKVKPEEWARGVRVAVKHFKPVIHVSVTTIHSHPRF